LSAYIPIKSVLLTKYSIVFGTSSSLFQQHGLIKQGTISIQIFDMLFFAVISILASQALGELIHGKNDAGQIRPSLSFTGTLHVCTEATLTSKEANCKGTIITPEGNDMNNRDCIAQSIARSIAALNNGQGGEYCLSRFADDNCEKLGNSEYVQLEEGGGDHCISLTDGMYGSYSWIKTSGLNVSRSRLLAICKWE
jgi:hypothetical protein